MGAPIKIMFCCEAPLLRGMVVGCLTGVDGLEVVGDAGVDGEAAKMAKRLSPDIIILSLVISGLRALETVREIRQRLPDQKFIVITTNPDEETVRQAIACGVRGMVGTNDPIDSFLTVINEVSRGNISFKIPGISNSRIESYLLGDQVASPLDQLTSRERQVFRLLSDGGTVPEIADGLALSVKTIDTHKTNLMRKLKVHNRAELVKRAIKLGIIKV